MIQDERIGHPVDLIAMRVRVACLAWMVATAACSAGPADAPDLGPWPAPTAPPQARANLATQGASSLNPRLLRRFKAIEPIATNSTDPERMRIRIGKQLFYDKRLSLHHDEACVTCHQLDRGGTDGLPTSRGTRGVAGKRNSPTVYNAAWHIAQFWDGRAHTSEEQAGMPMLDAGELGMRTAAQVSAVLRAVPAYVVEFAAAYPGDKSPTDFTHAVAAIAAFERTLMTPSRWDSFLRGDTGALTLAETEGLKLFADVGCVQCHTGELLGGSMFQRAGVAHPWPDQQDLGRFAITHDANDRMVFKVPSLRNVAITGPYFHDGRVTSLNEAVRMMGKYQLDVDLSPAEIESIVTWLKTLTGVPPPDALTPPELPPD